MDDKLYKDAKDCIIREVSIESLSAMYRVSTSWNKSATQQIQSIKQKDDVSYIADFLGCTPIVAHQILNYVHQFCQRYIAAYDAGTLNSDIRDCIANRIGIKTLKQIKAALTPRDTSTPKLTRYNATFGFPSARGLKLPHATLCLTVLAVTLRYITPPPTQFPVAHTIEDWLVVVLPNNAETQRLGEAFERLLAPKAQQKTHTPTKAKM